MLGSGEGRVIIGAGQDRGIVAVGQGRGMLGHSPEPLSPCPRPCHKSLGTSSQLRVTKPQHCINTYRSRL